jgi:hypothetical protein
VELERFQKVGMSDVATELNLGEDFRYTICPPKVQALHNKVGFNLSQKM